ncbi:MAG: hypothetical protein ACK50A_00110 [Sphingobacteriaceae bacterium]|jgi:hypothetical protein
MKNVLFLLALAFGIQLQAQTVKSKALKLKYTTPAGWAVSEAGGKDSWDQSGNDLCPCSSLHFTKDNKDGKLNVLVYPTTVNGLDSAKRNMVGKQKFVDVEKYDKTRNKNFSFEKRRSNFTHIKTNAKSYEVIRYKAKVDDHYYLIYTWQENMRMMSPDTEKELFEVINSLEPL